MKKVEIYTIDNCSYCDAAKSLLHSYKLEIVEHNLTNDEEAKFDLVRKTAHRTFPQIFIDGVFVGGYTDLKSHLSK